jgi:serine/threonine-protein kinase
MSDIPSPSRLPSAERWSVLEPIVDAALELPVERRLAFVEEQCAGDLALRDDVERILAASALIDERGLGLEQPASERFAALWDEQADEARFQREIAASYRIEAEVGRGGTAIVYRARRMRDDAVVALKVLRTTASAGGAPRFRREIALTMQLDHPHILRAIDSGETGGRLWYTMPFVAGDSLGARLRQGRMSISESVELLGQLASALGHAHANGIIHRDLKPDNVLLAEDGALVADFGVAKAILAAAHDPASDHGEPSTATGITLGTPSYMSPEQAAGVKLVDHRADLYALGVIAWELFTGTPPFTGTSRQALLTAHLVERPDGTLLERRGVPHPLAALVMRLLEKDVERRPASAADVIAVLESIAGEIPSRAPTRGPVSWLGGLRARFAGWRRLEDR